MSRIKPTHRTGGRISVPGRAHEAYALWTSGTTPHELATRYGVSVQAVYKWLRAVVESRKDARNG